MRAVTVVIIRVAVVIICIDPVNIVHIPVCIVVHTGFAFGLSLVYPHIIRQIGVAVINAGIQYHSDHIRRTGGALPRLGRVNIRIRYAGSAVYFLTGVMEAP